MVSQSKAYDFYPTKDMKLFAILNADFIRDYEKFMWNNRAIELRKKLRSQCGDTIKNKRSSAAMEKYGIDTLAIARQLGERPSPNHVIDHKIPLSAFDFHDKEQIKWAFAPENHQWLSKELNAKKSDYYRENGIIKRGKDLYG